MEASVAIKVNSIELHVSIGINLKNTLLNDESRLHMDTIQLLSLI